MRTSQREGRLRYAPRQIAPTAAVRIDGAGSLLEALS